MLNEIEQKKLNRILSLFVGKCGKFKPNQYRSFSGMRQASLKRTIKLMFGYDKSKNAVYSEPIEFSSMDMFLEVMRLLDMNLVKHVVKEDLFDGLDKEEEKEF